MSMDAATMAAAVIAAVDAEDPKEIGETMDQYRLRIETARANAIISHITSSATIVVVSVSGVTPGPGVSGAGTGTIS